MIYALLCDVYLKELRKEILRLELELEEAMMNAAGDDDDEERVRGGNNRSKTVPNKKVHSLGASRYEKRLKNLELLAEDDSEYTMLPKRIYSGLPLMHSF